MQNLSALSTIAHELEEKNFPVLWHTGEKLLLGNGFLGSLLGWEGLHFFWRSAIDVARRFQKATKAKLEFTVNVNPLGGFHSSDFTQATDSRT